MIVPSNPIALTGSSTGVASGVGSSVVDIMAN